MGRRMEAANEYVAYEPDRLVTFRTTQVRPVASYLFDQDPKGTRLTSRVELDGGILGPSSGSDYDERCGRPCRR